MTYAVIGKHIENGNIKVIGPFYQTARAERAAIVLGIAETDFDFKWVDLRDGVSTVANAKKSIRQQKRNQANDGKTENTTYQ
jgi:hypothetical protein